MQDFPAPWDHRASTYYPLNRVQCSPHLETKPYRDGLRPFTNIAGGAFGWLLGTLLLIAKGELVLPFSLAPSFYSCFEGVYSALTLFIQGLLINIFDALNQYCDVCELF